MAHQTFNNINSIEVQTMKRSRARVTLGGQYLLLQIRIKMPKILKKKTKYPYESHLDRNIAEPLKKIVKILEIRPQSIKNAQKSKKNCKHTVNTLLFGFQ